MFFCPYCGTRVKSEEKYCLNCGKKLPADLTKRIDTSKQKFNRLWFLPIALLVLALLIVIFLFYLAEKNTNSAIDYYEESETLIAEEKYDLAAKKLEKSLKLKPKFDQASIALDFVQIAKNINNNIEQARELLSEGDFHDALSLINESERELRSYHGEMATKLIDLLSEERDLIKFHSLLLTLEDSPSIDDLKVLLWEAEAIKTEEAIEVAENIRRQIADYTHTKAMELLNKHQFTDAHTLVIDGLKYASNSKKLISLQETIDKEQEAFETEQQMRIEQAIHLAEEERELNEMEAVELKDVNFEVDEQGVLIVTGEVKSVATIPIHSIIVKYSLYHNKDEEAYLTNKAFVFPDNLYPGETGEFEFTHYDIDEDITITNIQIEKFTWYTNY